MNYLVYLAFGGEDYYNETLFSLLSYYRHHPDGENTVVIYTDAPDFFGSRIPRKIDIIETTPEQIKEWKGKKDYPYRVKLKVLQDAVSRFNDNIIYVDTDTVFTNNITTLFKMVSEGAMLMDACEGPLRENNGGIARKMKKILRRQSVFNVPGSSIPVNLTDGFVVWNSGCVGFNRASVDDKLDNAVKLMDILFETYPLYTMEQIALTYYFEQGNLHEAKNHIHHYWYFKEFRQVLRQFFAYHKDIPFPLLIEKAAEIDPVEYSESKRSYKKMSFWQKQRHKLLTGKKWEVPAYKPN